MYELPLKGSGITSAAELVVPDFLSRSRQSRSLTNGLHCFFDVGVIKAAITRAIWTSNGRMAW
jgi:hypothetical protein